MDKHKHQWDANEHFLEAGRDTQTILMCKFRGCQARISLGDQIQILGYEQSERALRVNRKMFWVALGASGVSIISIILQVIFYYSTKK